ncbi:hypothetical protein HMPREF9371_0345 [Neisseria shayeganii 871]|uniref:Uncharacterized protein n=1 Tax=Neisseria shayeganii 871 TaxID=1032488 RepID=G4CFF6_9NEIS|nr:hypothetical protein HMPREF9371_0345 [Neisseria shayeganii 871]
MLSAVCGAGWGSGWHYRDNQRRIQAFGAEIEQQKSNKYY